MFSSNTSQVSSDATYIEDVFSTWLYTGNDSTQTINNGIDLDGKGGLVWIKNRNSANSHGWWDTVRGAGTGSATASNRALSSNLTDAQGLASLPSANSDYLSAFTASGFTVVDPGIANEIANAGGQTYASWTFRKQPKFFDVVTYTGDSTNNRQISHSLGATPGCIIIKIINGNNSWIVWHNSLPTQAGELNATGSFLSAYYTNLLNGAPTSTTFTVSHNGFNTTNETGYTYVAYLFAHDAGGFGLTGTDNVISCGSYTGNGSTTGPTVSLGYEPQWLMIKNASGTGNWQIIDNMRGMPVGSADAALQANLSNAESSVDYVSPTATGFQVVSTSSEVNTNASTYIYIAIRRGPMKTPTTGTSVFSPILSSDAQGTQQTTNFPVDLQVRVRPGTTSNRAFSDRLRSVSTNTTSSGLLLYSNSTSIEASDSGATLFWNSTGFQIPPNNGGFNSIYWNFRRAPGFFDEVCYTGTGVARTVAHNLGVAPELMIVKKRSAADAWIVYANNDNTDYLVLNTTAATVDNNTIWNDTSPTSSVFTVGTNDDVNGNTATFVAYLFASCPGVSKVGSYTGTGTTQQINCGFTAGARFVLIKRTDSTGDWYVWDSARGIVAGNDPYLLLNSTAAEVTNTDYVDTYAQGFEISSFAPAAINANGGTFIFLAIA